ncbi:MAG: hypothetical protein JW715_11145 [Sedimentisphaerales bacterium]|nr:hypothetical protein [Sedimentisphaerales bacterium]
MIKGLILTAVGAGVSFFISVVMLYELKEPPIDSATFLIAPILFGISIAVLVLGVALLNKSHKKDADTNPGN